MKFKFIDLFSGIGCFHQAMKNLGGECVFSADINKECAKTYKNNWNMDSLNDITKLNEKDIPTHDVVCSGFPCQSFSICGNMKGFEDTRGTMIFEVFRILNHHKSKIVILENVPNLVSHNNGETYKVIINSLDKLGYSTPKEPIIISPQAYGIPQHRPRLFIIGIRKDLIGNVDKYDFNNPKNKETNIFSVLDEKVNPKYNLKEDEFKILSAWDEFIQHIGSDKLTGTTYSIEFGRTNDYSNETKHKLRPIKRSRELYDEHKEFIDNWLLKWNVRNFPVNMQSLNWSAQNAKSLWDCLIQYRQNAIRVCKVDYSPCILANNKTLVIGKYKRYITPRECARLQSLPDTFKLHEKDKEAYKQIGNGANVTVIEELTKMLFKGLRWI